MVTLTKTIYITMPRVPDWFWEWGRGGELKISQKVDIFAHRPFAKISTFCEKFGRRNIHFLREI
jgi:hypothetical protein